MLKTNRPRLRFCKAGLEELRINPKIRQNLLGCCTGKGTPGERYAAALTFITVVACAGNGVVRVELDQLSAFMEEHLDTLLEILLEVVGLEVAAQLAQANADGKE